MTMDEIDEIVEQRQAERHRKPDNREFKMRQIRNVLNIIFMVVAVVGVGLCLGGKQTIGTYVFVASIPFKFAEVAIRILKL